MQRSYIERHNRGEVCLNEIIKVIAVVARAHGPTGGAARHGVGAREEKAVNDQPQPGRENKASSCPLQLVCRMVEGSRARGPHPPRSRPR
eukprot:2769719-Pleurochrysis_carterae.AAC.1